MDKVLPWFYRKLCLPVIIGALAGGFVILSLLFGRRK